MKKCNSCILLFIRLTKTVKEKQLNLITTWFIWTLPDRIGSDSYNKMTPVKHIFNYMSMIHNKFESWSLTINWDLAVQNLKKEGFLRYFRYLTGSRNYLCSLHCIDENLIINTEISITYLIKNLKKTNIFFEYFLWRREVRTNKTKQFKQIYIHWSRSIIPPSFCC